MIASVMRLAYIAFFLEVGLLLIVVPWSGFWDQNYFASAWPVLQAFFSNNFVRGGVTGLGLVNLIAAVSELRELLSSRGRHDGSLGRHDSAATEL